MSKIKNSLISLISSKNSGFSSSWMAYLCFRKLLAISFCLFNIVSIQINYLSFQFRHMHRFHLRIFHHFFSKSMDENFSVFSSKVSIFARSSTSFIFIFSNFLAYFGLQTRQIFLRTFFLWPSATSNFPSYIFVTSGHFIFSSEKILGGLRSPKFSCPFHLLEFFLREYPFILPPIFLPC